MSVNMFEIFTFQHWRAILNAYTHWQCCQLNDFVAIFSDFSQKVTSGKSSDFLEIF